MNKNLLIAAIVALAVLAFVMLRGQDAGNNAAVDNKSAHGEKLGASAVLKIDPAAPSAYRAPPKMALAPPSPAIQAWRDHKDWPGLYKQLAALNPPTAESQYLLAEMLTSCAKRSQSNAQNNPQNSAEARRNNFLASLPPKDPNLERRKAAFEQMNAEHCGDLAQIPYDEAAVKQLLDASAAAGDPRARAWLLAQEITQTMEADRQKEPGQRHAGYPVTEAQFATMRDLLASQDPTVIGEFRNIMASTLSGAALRIGPNQEAIDSQAMYHAIGLVACDFGAPCGANTNELLSACALSARCDTGNLYDYTYYYGVPPYAAQLVERYRDYLTQMISSGNMSNLNMVTVPQSQNVSVFISGRRR